MSCFVIQYSIHLFKGEWKLNLITRGASNQKSEKTIDSNFNFMILEKWMNSCLFFKEKIGVLEVIGLMIL